MTLGSWRVISGNQPRAAIGVVFDMAAG